VVSYKKKREMKNLKDIFKINESENPSPHLEIAVESGMDGNSRSMQEHLIELLYDELQQLNDDVKANKVFRFTSIPVIEECESFEANPIIKDILSDSLTFSNPVNFNDPMDPILRTWINIQKRETSCKQDKKLYESVGKIIKSNIRMSCLATPNTNKIGGIEHESDISDCSLLMWSHYADMHKGLCIEYEVPEKTLEKYNDENHLLKWCKVRYRDRKTMCGYITLDNALLAKADCWKYEEESRLIYYTKHKRDFYQNNKRSDYFTISGFRVTAVYMGYRIDNKLKAFLKKHLKLKGIPLYEMNFCREDITRVEKIKCE
jgi:hypothetical protein